VKFDVLVVGGGPAGSAAAISLARANRSVCVLEATNYNSRRVGEHLAPKARQVLGKLGCPDVLEESAALSSPGIRSFWGETERNRDYLFERGGEGWNLDRARFDRALASQAEKAGAILSLGAHARVVERVKRGWRVTARCQEGLQEFNAMILVDATGPAAFVARRLGAKRIKFDHLVARVSWIHCTNPMDHRLIVEAVDNGWWYSVPIPGDQLVTAFLTDADYVNALDYRSSEFSRPHLCRSRDLRQDSPITTVVPSPLICPAESAVLDRPSGPDWIAVGDAAFARDPLSASGIKCALESGMAAAAAILRYLGGAVPSLADNPVETSKTIGAYLVKRAEIYRDETRWSGEPFWKRRQVAEPATQADDLSLNHSGMEWASR